MRTELGSAEMAELAREAVSILIDAVPDMNQRCDTKPIVEVGGHDFGWLGEGTERMAVQGDDGVVYKTSKVWVVNDCPCGRIHDSQTEKELALFDALAAAEIPWCPDYCAYGSVVAMPRYTTQQDSKRRVPSSILNDMIAITSDISPCNVGFDAEGKPYLIDGGYGALTGTSESASSESPLEVTPKIGPERLQTPR